MLLQEPGQSPYDVRFSLFGFPTRISWTFWLVAIVLGYDFAQTVDIIFQPNSPGTVPLLLIWVACMAASILIHELGHALAFRRYGMEAQIVLYYLGGLAIPTMGFRGARSARSTGSREDLIIAAAGPAFQIGSALLLVLIAWSINYEVMSFQFMPGPLADLGRKLGGREIESVTLYALLNFYVWPSIMWGLLNLVPVLPLDGGRVAKAIIEMQRGDVTNAYWISVITAALLSLYGFSSGQTFLGIFFASLAINNYQAIHPGSSW